jgi:hypothetical protein
MNLMQLIKNVLDDSYSAINAPDDVSKDNQIRKELDNLSSEYRTLVSSASSPIDYSDSVKRFAYIYKYTVAHADYIMQIIEESHELRKQFSNNSIEVTCLGGGPGSDLLGILKYLIRSNAKNLSLKCYIFDKERSWGDSWSDVASQLSPPFSIFPVFQQMDVTDPTTWSSYQKFLRADLFTLSYFLSEVFKIKNAAEPFFEYCMSHMKTGSMMLFLDNNDSRFRNWFDEMATKHGLVQIQSCERELCFSNDEEKRDLGRYFDKFGWPKRKSEAAWRVMRKS